MNKQEIFDKVLAHSRTMTEKSIIGDTCKYRDDKGGMCFIGCLLSDKDYNPEMDSAISHTFTADEIFEIAGVGGHIELGTQLQLIHDNAEMSKWEREFKHLATAYDVSYTEA